MFQHIDYIVCFISPSGGIGIRARLKIVSRKGCGFDSHLGHRNKKLSTVSAFLFWSGESKPD